MKISLFRNNSGRKIGSASGNSGSITPGAVSVRENERNLGEMKIKREIRHSQESEPQVNPQCTVWVPHSNDLGERKIKRDLRKEEQQEQEQEQALQASKETTLPTSQKGLINTRQTLEAKLFRANRTPNVPSNHQARRGLQRTAEELEAKRVSRGQRGNRRTFFFWGNWKNRDRPLVEWHSNPLPNSTAEDPNIQMVGDEEALSNHSHDQDTNPETSQEDGDDLSLDSKEEAGRRKTNLQITAAAAVAALILVTALVVVIPIVILQNNQNSEGLLEDYNGSPTHHQTASKSTDDPPPLLLVPNMTETTIEAIRTNPLSRQARAYDFISKDPNWDTFEDWRKQQRFALLCILYTFQSGGEDSHLAI